MTLLKITKENENKILKSFLIEKFSSSLSSSKISKSIQSGDIKVNNKKVLWNYILKENDEIKIYLKLPKDNYDFLDSNDEIKIVYEDENILVVDKPRGLVCQKDMNTKIDTLNNRIKKYLYTNNDPSFEVAHLVHRLDKYTCGLCVAGKSEQVIKYLNENWNSNYINKYYRCLALGKFKNKSETLIDYIKINEDKKIMEIDQSNIYNKKIITHYEIIKQYKDFAELLVKIDTGRKHQIRVHLASIGHPILGDTKYNNKNNLLYRYPCLVSYKISFNFPIESKLNYLNDVNIKLKNVVYK